MESHKNIEEKWIDIKRGHQGYGFIISNQSPCVVSCIAEEGPAKVAGLKVGDQILYVNGLNSEKLSHEEVVRLILGSTGMYVRLKVRTERVQCITAGNTVKELNTTETETVGAAETVAKNNDERRGSGDILRRTIPINGSDIVARDKTKARRGFTSKYASFQSDSDVAVVSWSDDDASSTSSILSGTDAPQDIPPSPRDDGDSLGWNGVRLLSVEWEKRESLSTSRTLYPILAPISADESQGLAEYQVVVGYLCTIELPGEAFLPSTSLNAITNCVKRLNKNGKKVNTKVIMSMSVNGVTLKNNTGKDIVTYPLKSLAFTGTCPYDKRFFGLVTRKTLTQQITKWSPILRRKAGNIKKTRVCSCHVFMVDPDLSDHETHLSVAEQFQIVCTKSTEFGGCKEFPRVSSVVLYALNSLFRERKSARNSLSDCEQEISVDDIVLSKSRFRKDSQQTFNIRKMFASDTSNRSADELSDSGSGVSSSEKSNVKERGNPSWDSAENDQRASPSLFSRLKLKQKFNRRASKLKPKTIPRAVSQDTGTSLYNSLLDSETRSRKCLSEDTGTAYEYTRKPYQSDVSDSPQAFIVDNTSGGLIDDSDRNSVRVESSFASYIKDIAEDESPQVTGEKKISQCETLSDSVSFEDLDCNHDLKRSASSENDINASNCKLDMCEGGPQTWGRSLETLLADPVGVKYFQEFLRKEFSEENIIFWNACERLKKLTKAYEIASLADQIFTQHLCSGAPLLVNVDQQAAKKAEETLEKPHANMFELQQEQIFKLMKYDSFPRFLKSGVYQQCLLMDDQDEDDEARRGKSIWYVRKSKSNAKDLQDAAERKRSILNFLSKGKTGKQELPVKKNRSRSVASVIDNSRRSSLASLPDLLEYRTNLPNTPNPPCDNDHGGKKFCRVVFPDSTTIDIPTDSNQSIRVCLKNLCEQEKMKLSAYDVYVGADKQNVDLDSSVQVLSGTLVYLEKRILFRFDLPNQRSVGVKERPSRTLKEVLEPILKRNGYQLNDLVITLAGSRLPLNLDLTVQKMEHKHLCAQNVDQIRRSRQSTGGFAAKPPLAEFRSSIKRLRGQVKDEDKIFAKPKGYGLKPVKSEESLAKQGGLNKRSVNSFKTKDKRLSLSARSKSVDLTDEAKSELIEVLRRTSSGRLDDQRGRLAKEQLELPQFLKEQPRSSSVQPTLSDDKKRSLSSGALMTLAQQQEFLDIDPSDFRPASEIFNDTSFQSFSGRDSLYSVRSWSEIPSPDRQRIRASSPRASLLGRELDRELATLGRLSVGSVPCIGSIRGDDSDSFLQDTSLETTVTTSSDRNQECSSDVEGKAYEKRVNEKTSGWDSQRSSPESFYTDEEDNQSTHSEPGIIPKCSNSPRSPLVKQQKLDSNEAEPPRFVVPCSPVYTKRTVQTRKTRPRPAPICERDATLKLNRSDSASRRKIITGQTPRCDNNTSDGKVESASSSALPSKDESIVIYNGDGVEQGMDDKENNSVVRKLFESRCLQRTDSNASDVSVLNTEVVTVTGSINDETVVLEDKDMSPGLLNLLQRKRVNKCRRPQSHAQVQPEREKLLNGETIRGKKNERITFV